MLFSVCLTLTLYIFQLIFTSTKLNKLKLGNRLLILKSVTEIFLVKLLGSILIVHCVFTNPEICALPFNNFIYFLHCFKFVSEWVSNTEIIQVIHPTNKHHIFHRICKNYCSRPVLSNRHIIWNRYSEFSKSFCVSWMLSKMWLTARILLKQNKLSLIIIIFQGKVYIN